MVAYMFIMGLRAILYNQIFITKTNTKNNFYIVKITKITP